ncbi:hypothetical protein AN958_05715 [Leucoagaricus sp. SymC.cos]|nr:hypothetical protein AN958_05715 [Leucoagaricus sp. SymC.cos]
MFSFPFPFTAWVDARVACLGLFKFVGRWPASDGRKLLKKRGCRFWRKGGGERTIDCIHGGSSWIGNHVKERSSFY